MKAVTHGIKNGVDRILFVFIIHTKINKLYTHLWCVYNIIFLKAFIKTSEKTNTNIKTAKSFTKFEKTLVAKINEFVFCEEIPLMRRKLPISLEVSGICHP